MAIERLADSELAAVGAPGRDNNTASLTQNSGAVCLFRRMLPDGAWVFEERITNIFGNFTLNMQAGRFVALSGGQVAIGSVTHGFGFHAYNDTLGRWVQFRRHGLGAASLAGFDRGFLVGSGTTGLSVGSWDRFSRNHYDAFQNMGGFFPAGTVAKDRRADADPDGDGIPNALEAFYGTGPLDPNPPVMRPTLHTPTQQFRLQWQQALNTQGLGVEVSWTDNPGADTWSTNGITLVNVGAVPGGGAVGYEARLPKGDLTNVFFRMTIR